MFFQMMQGSNYMNLQATLSAASATSQEPVVLPHHPLTCPGDLHLDETTFSCDHAKVPVDDQRTRAAIIHSVAILMFEIAGETL